MQIVTLSSAEKVPFKLDGRKMFSSDKLELVHLNLQPDEEIGLHSNPFDVVFFILEGHGTVFSEETSHLVEQNMTIFIEREKQRGMKNTTDKPFKVLVCKIY